MHLLLHWEPWRVTKELEREIDRLQRWDFDPQVMAAVSGQPAFKPVAEEAAGRLAAALDTLRP